MIEIRGKYGTTKVFNDFVEQSAMSQIYDMMNSKISEHSKVRIMSDVHAGAGCVIGYTSTLTDLVSPNLIGVDIGCGVSGWNIGKDKVDFAKLDKFIRKLIPCGSGVRDEIYNDYEFAIINDIEDICDRTEQDTDRVLRSLGSLGGGNHFIEIDKDDDGNKWLLIHSGSRNFGLKVANWHQKIAKSITNLGPLSYLEGEDAIDYFNDMAVAQKYAGTNRRIMGKIILEEIFEFVSIPPFVESVHNYINFNDKIVRKGAISAHKDEYVLIPLNMADGTIIGKGKGNEDWNYSAPHGAGRAMSRSKAKETIDLKDFEDIMEGIWTSCVSKHTLDESPFAYKSAEDTIKYLEPTVEIESHMKSVYAFKGN